MSEPGGWGQNPRGCHHQRWGPAWWHHGLGVRGGVTHADLQAGLALEGGREGDSPALGDGVGEAEPPDLPPAGAGGPLHHGHPRAARLPALHQQHRLPPRCRQPALLQLQVGRVVLPPHGRLPRGGGHGRVSGRGTAGPPLQPGHPAGSGTWMKASLLTSSSVCGASKAAVGKRRRKSSRGILHWKATCNRGHR